MRSYITCGDAARLVPNVTTVLWVLSANADMKTGQVSGLGVDKIAALGGLDRQVGMKALAAARDAGYVERLDEGGKGGRRAVWRLLHKASICSGSEVVGTASWPYVPMQEAAQHKSLKCALATGQAGAISPPAGVTIEVHQHITLVQQVVEQGGTGIVNISTDNPDLIGIAVKSLAAAAPGEREKWRKLAISRGAPSCTTIMPARLGEWAAWVAPDLLPEERQ
jgi:hypothetical protein